MSEYSAKSLRDARKARAQKMASADPHEKVDSSTWTPPDALNADVKTGMRPLSRRAFKSGGKVEGACGPMRADKAPRKKSGGGIGTSMANKNMKQANQDREGLKHVGGMNKGGRAGKLSGGALGKYIKRAAVDSAMESRKSGYQEGQSGKSGAGKEAGEKALNRMAGIGMAVNKLTGKAKVPASEREGRKDGGSTYSEADRARLEEMIRQAQKGRDLRNAEQMYEGRAPQPRDLYSVEQLKRLERGYKKGGRAKKADGGRGMGEAARNALANRERDDAEHAISEAKLSQANADTGGKWGRAKNEEIAASKWHDYAKNKSDRVNKETGYSSSNFYKKGGRAKKMNGGGMDPRLGLVSPTRMKFAGAQGTPYKKGGAAHSDEAMDKALIKKMVKPEARTGRKDGGRTKGKTHINIVIAAGKPNQDGPSGLPGMPGMGGMPGMRPPVAPIPMAPAPMPGGMPGMAPGAPQMPPPQAPMARKSGGRVAKVARSYKDMETGAGSGEGRLQKTDIAARLPKKKEDGMNVYDGLGYPNKVPGATGGRTARKAGGGVYRSYKDMDAGAGSGEGRLEKTEIQRGKRGR